MTSQIHVYGAGAVGTLVAGFLLKDGESVALVDPRTALHASFDDKGLRVDGVRRVWADAAIISPDDVPESLQQVILACPADAVADILDEIAPKLAPDAVVVTLQPGFSHLRVAEMVGAERVIVGHTSFVAEQDDDGLVRYLDPGEFVLGRLDSATDAALVSFVTRFSRIMDTTLTTNIAGYAWTSSCLNAVTLLLQLAGEPARESVDDPAVRGAIRAVLAEATAEIARQGVQLEPFDAFDPQQLLADGREAAAHFTHLGLRPVVVPPDAIWLVGELRQTLERAGVACPAITRLEAAAQAVAAGVRQPGLDLMDRIQG